MEWRGTRDPYRIWVSEIMLQQTRVETVAPYYGRFIARFPDVAAVAVAALDEILSLWAGLGYYARARNLHRTARIVVEQYNGTLPSTVAELMRLPGIGRSTAGAIAAIAFGRDAPILDANARRVLSRLFAVRGDVRAAAVESVLWDRSTRLVRRGKGRETALALMDLGATVCIPKDPRCGACPVSNSCAAFADGLQGRIPEKRRPKRVPHHDIAAALFRNRRGCVLVLRRPPEGLLGGLWAFPSGKRAPGESVEAGLRRAIREKLGVKIAIQRKVGTVRHAYSHYRITLHGFLCGVAAGALPSGPRTRWIQPGDAEGCALPRADRKLVEHFQQEGSR
jgi:A/G-specific adenine glycosylase